MRRLTIDEKESLKDWQAYLLALVEESGVDSSEPVEVQRRRVQALEADVEEWFRYYFPTFSTAPATDFHRAATRRLLEHDRWYEVRSWSRELAKSTRAMMEVIYLALTGQVRNVLLVSNSQEKATDLLRPFKLVLERSPRITHDYGVQPTQGHWEEDKFSVSRGCSFRAIGAGQSPRGVKNKEARPDFILIDDIDTDEEVRNPDRIRTKWEWFEKALFPTLSVSGKYRILFCGNVIAKDCCITRAGEKADKWDIVNIRDEEGRSTWPEKNSEADIDRVLGMISTAAAQQEYFNNPVSEGEVFRDLTWDECPPLRELPFAVCYGDPSPSNSRSRQSSYKAVFLVGYHEGKYYIYTGYLDHETNARFVSWYHDIRDYVHDQCPVYYLVENNSLQDPIYEQVLLPLFVAEGTRRGMIPIAPDARAKMDKYTRIEGALEPLARQGRLVFNSAERGNPQMQRLEDQFRLFAPKLPAPADGPDCIEGAVWQISRKLSELQPDSIIFGGHRHNSKRF